MTIKLWNKKYQIWNGIISMHDASQTYNTMPCSSVYKADAHNADCMEENVNVTSTCYSFTYKCATFKQQTYLVRHIFSASVGAS